MTYVLIVIGLLFLLVLIRGLRNRAGSHGFDSVSFGAPRFIKGQLYKTRFSIFSKSEVAFFLELKSQLPAGYYVFPKMRIADVIQPIHGHGYYNRRNKILPKHVDFLICDYHFKPVVAVELDGGYHRRPDVLERDALKKDIFQDARLPLKHIDVGASFVQSVGDIVKEFCGVSLSVIGTDRSENTNDSQAKAAA